MAEIDDPDDDVGPQEGEEIVENLQMTGRIAKKWGRADVFAQNLRFLAALKGLNAGSLAKKVQSMLVSTGEHLQESGEMFSPDLMQQNMKEIEKDPVDPRWVRRLMKEGISKPSPRTYKHLHALALFFDVEPESFWNPDLAALASRPHNFETVVYDKDLVLTEFDTLHMRKLAKLLAREKYQYLKSLIDSLFDEMEKSEKRIKRKKKK